MPAPPARLHSLDVLRGLAAYGIVFWHWQFFVSDGPFAPERQPLFDVLFLFYKRGALAVDFFFCLSGFVFHWLYARQVSEGAISARSFAVLRLSRLYPLHLATLLAVAAGQAVHRMQTGHAYVYYWNDAWHFALNALFASSWGLERGLSFNGPAWSVSVEIALYAAFFALCRLSPPRFLHLLAGAVIGFFVLLDVHGPLGRGVGAFFTGGIAWLAYDRLRVRPDVRHLTRVLVTVSCALWAAAAVAVRAGWTDDVAAESLLLDRLLIVWPSLLLFPLTVLTSALAETVRGTLGRRFSVLGDLSYATYMLHFPLMLLLVNAVLLAGADITALQGPWMLGTFLLLLTVTSLLARRCFELPLQRRLRAAWLRPAPPVTRPRPSPGGPSRRGTEVEASAASLSEAPPPVQGQAR
jgi:peptidoglycan/LPS O-acetylase OafA/YrhL